MQQNRKNPFVFSTSLSEKKTTIQEKALHKSPFTLNNHTYFASECFYENTIINGISLNVTEGRGLSNDPAHISYLNYSQKFIYQAGCNILAYNTYRRNYEVICQTGTLHVLRATSLSTPQKQYIIWGQKIIKKEFQGQKIISKVCIYSMHKKQLIFSEKFLSLHEFDDVFAFMHPIKVVGSIFYNPVTENSTLIFKKLSESDGDEFEEEYQVMFPYDLRNMEYDVESNSYIFKHGTTLKKLVIEANTSPFEGEDSQSLLKPENFNLKVLKGIELPNEIYHFCINQAYIAILTGNYSSRVLKFYSTYNFDFVFEQEIQSLTKQNILASSHTIEKPLPLINYFEFKKSIIIGVYGDSYICIFSVYEQSLRHVRDTELGLQNCLTIQKIYINPYNSEVLITSRHYQLEGVFSNAIQSKKYINFSSDPRFKNVYLEVSTFFITMQASMINVKKLGLGQKKYCAIITLPWMNQIYFQTENSVLCSRWEQKFDAIIKCSAIHPMGQFLGLGFSDCFKIYYLTYEGLEHSFISQNVKQCCSLSFSDRGNQFAVANSCLIFIYECYSFTKKHQINLGVSHKISQISYQNEHLYCFSKNYRLWVYDMNVNYKEQFTFNPRSHIQSSNPLDSFIFQIMKKNTRTLSAQSGLHNKINSVMYDNLNAVVIFSAVSKIYFINSLNYECLGCYDFYDVTCMEYCAPLSTLFMGTQCGKIVAFPWPNKPMNISSKLPTFDCHNKKIENIKVSSDLFYLISITDTSLYKHELTKIVEMKKLSKYELQRECAPEVILSLDFLTRKGLCLFTNEAFERKHECIKQNQEEALNMNFILPQEREKQKNKMLNKLQKNKEDCENELQDTYQPLKILAMNMKQKNRILDDNIQHLKVSAFEQRQQDRQKYRQQMTRLCEQKENLQVQLSKLRTSCQNSIKKQKSIMKNEMKIQEIEYYVKIEDLEKKTKEIENQKNQTLINFHEISEIDEEKKVFEEEVLKKIDEEIAEINQRSGFLMCRNTNLQKQIYAKKRKIEDIQDMIQSIKRSIQGLPKKSKQSIPERINEKLTNQFFYQTQQKYQKQTKKLIQKNKAVNVSIQMYSKERDVLIALEKEIQKYEDEIQMTIEYVNHEKTEKREVEERLEELIDKVKLIMKVHERKYVEKTKVRSQYQALKYKVALYLDGIVSLKQLKKSSRISPDKMVKVPIKIQKQIQNKKKKIEKITIEESKTINLMNSHRKIFSNEKKKIYMQNQDLLVTYNTLCHKNKYLVNLIKTQDDPNRKINLPHKSKNKLDENLSKNNKPTPFQDYIRSKTSRRIKTTPCAQYNL